MAKEKKKKTNGGSDLIVKTKEVEKGKEPEIEPELEHESEAQPQSGEGGVSPEAIEVNKALIETICVMVSRMAVAIIGMEDIAFTDPEVEQLKNLWSPFMPSISPVATAILGTVIIVGGKVGVYMIKKRETKKSKPAKTAETAKGKVEEKEVEKAVEK